MPKRAFGCILLTVGVLTWSTVSLAAPPPLPSAISVFVGPLTATGDTAHPLVHAYDQAQSDQGRRFADGFPAYPNDLLLSTYYDLPLALYTLYYRTGDAYWLERARLIARAWRDWEGNRNIEPFLAGNWSLGPTVPAPRSMSTLGLAVLAVEAGDAEARRIVHLHGRLVQEALMQSPGNYGLGNPYMPLADAREAGYSLMALLASTVLGEDRRAAARTLVDAVLARQQPSGQWQSWSEAMSGTPFTLNYMNGILMDALVQYDRIVGDPRIVPALERALAWTWTTQWLPSARAFQYGNINAGDIDTQPAPTLNGLILPAWGYVFAKTGNPAYHEQGLEMVRGLVDTGIAGIWGPKQFGEAFRSSARFFGFTPSLEPPPPPPPASIDVLVGPVAPAGSTEPLVSQYDRRALALGAQFGDAFPAYPGDLAASSARDLALALYTLYYRTADPLWRTRARSVATAWRDAPNNQNIEPFLAGNWSLGSTVPAPPRMSTLGLAILATEAGDAEARRIVGHQARLVEVANIGASGQYGLNNTVMPLGNAENAGAALIALTAATMLGHDHAQSARALVDAIIARQHPSGQWASWSEPMGATVFTVNAMNGVLMEALMLYDRAIGDPRIVPALERAVAWTWTTQWVPSAEAFQFADISAGGLDQHPSPELNGLLLPVWGYLADETGNPAYRTQGEQIFSGLVRRGMDAVWGPDPFTALFRSSGRYLGFTRTP